MSTMTAIEPDGEYGPCPTCSYGHLETYGFLITCPHCDYKCNVDDYWRCSECSKVRVGDDRVQAGMKCGPCAYGGR